VPRETVMEIIKQEVNLQLSSIGVSSSRVKRPARETKQSLPSSDEVKIVWSHTSTPPYVFMPCCIVKRTAQLYSGRKITESLGNVTVRGEKYGKSKRGSASL
jgi:hypothetical protein